MSNFNKTKKVSAFTRFLWFVAGADAETLSECPHDYNKFGAIGMTILMTALVGFASGASAAWYFTENGLWTFVFGLFWSLLIFSIDRSLVVTLKKNPYKNSYRYFIPPLFFRALLALIVAGIMSIPLELFLFNGFIQGEEQNYRSHHLKQQEQDSYFSQKAGEYGSIVDSLNNKLQEGQDKESRIENEIDEWNSELVKERNKLNHPNTPTYNNAQENLRRLYNQLNGLYSLPDNDSRRNGIPDLNTRIKRQTAIMVNEKNAWNLKVNGRISDIENKISQLQSNLQEVKIANNRTEHERLQNDSIAKRYETGAKESIEKTDSCLENGTKFTLYYAILSYAIYKTHEVTKERTKADGEKEQYKEEEYVNVFFIFLLWLIRLGFFVIELLPSVVKIASKVGQYELVVYHQEEELKKYLHSQEFQNYCYNMLHDKHISEIDLQKQRLDAEKKVQQDIIQAIATAELSVAKYHIDNWEKNEKHKQNNTPTS